jgi:hypothetical protein
MITSVIDMLTQSPTQLDSIAFYRGFWVLQIYVKLCSSHEMHQDYVLEGERTVLRRVSIFRM